MLVGVSVLLLSAGALAELLDSVGTGVEFAAGLTAAALALVDLVVLPFGTALGVYALWVLLTNEGRHMFEVTGA